MKTTRFDQGWQKLMEIDGEGGNQVITSLQDIAPDLGNMIVEFAFGDIYTRDHLTLQERELITIASLCTTGACTPQLTVHIHGALHVGISKDTIIETFLQCIPYVGFPKVLNAIYTAKEIFKDLQTR